MLDQNPQTNSSPVAETEQPREPMPVALSLDDAAKALRARHPIEQNEEETSEAPPPDHEPAEVESDGSDGPVEETEVQSSESKLDAAEREVEPSTEPEAVAEERMLRADYTRKTQELAELRRQAEQAMQQAMQIISNGQDPVLAAWQQLGPEGQAKLAEESPAEYVQRRAQVEQRWTAIQQAQQQMQQQQHQHVQQLLAEESKRILKALPEWQKEEVRKKEVPQLLDYLRTQGFSQQEVNTIHDSRLVLTARKAMLYDSMMAKQKELAKKKVVTPSKTIQPGNGDANRDDSTNVRALEQRFKKAPSMENALARLQAKRARLENQ